MKTCCFTGSRPESFPWKENESDFRCVELKKQIFAAVSSLADDGYCRFISGMARGADIFCAEAVIELMREREGITLECAVPCPEQARSWSKLWKDRREAVLERAGNVVVLCPHYTNFCMAKRNEYMVDSSDFVLAVWGGQTYGGTYGTIQKAKRAEKLVKIIRYD